MGGAMDSLLGNNNNSSNQDNSRRSSTPSSGNSGSAGGGFSSMFKSVINAASKTTTPQPAPTTSNFYVSSPPVAPEPIVVDSHSPSHAVVSPRSVQGIVGLRVVSVCVFLVCSLFWWNIVLINFLVLAKQKSNYSFEQKVCCEFSSKGKRSMVRFGCGKTFDTCFKRDMFVREDWVEWIRRTFGNSKNLTLTFSLINSARHVKSFLFASVFWWWKFYVFCFQNTFFSIFSVSFDLAWNDAISFSHSPSSVSLHKIMKISKTVRNVQNYMMKNDSSAGSFPSIESLHTGKAKCTISNILHSVTLLLETNHRF